MVLPRKIPCSPVQSSEDHFSCFTNFGPDGVDMIIKSITNSNTLESLRCLEMLMLDNELEKSI